MVARMVRNLLAMWETWVQSLGWEDSLKEGMATHSSILAWRIPMDRGAWWAAVHGVTKLDMTEQLSIAYICVCMYIWPYYMAFRTSVPSNQGSNLSPCSGSMVS